MHVYHASFNHDIPVVPTRKTHSSSSVTETQRSTPRFSRGNRFQSLQISHWQDYIRVRCCLRRELARFWNRAIDKESMRTEMVLCEVITGVCFRLTGLNSTLGSKWRDKQIRGCALVHHSRCPDTKTLLMLFIICICAYDWVLFKQPYQSFISISFYNKAIFLAVTLLYDSLREKKAYVHDCNLQLMSLIPYLLMCI